MDSPREIWSRLRLWLRSDEMEREMDEEMRFHIEKLIERNVREGMSPEEARRNAIACEAPSRILWLLDDSARVMGAQAVGLALPMRLSAGRL